SPNASIRRCPAARASFFMRNQWPRTRTPGLQSPRDNYLLITSPHNPRVKAAARLREPRGRARQGRIVIDGGREISRALDGGLAIREVFVLDGRRKASSSDWREKNIAEIIKRLAAAGAEIWETTLPVF